MCMRLLSPALLAARTTHPLLVLQSGAETPSFADQASAAALVAGTAIGGGFLALPYTTAPLGFLPSSACLTTCAAVLFVQACVLADVVIDASLSRGEPASLADVSREAFGPVGERAIGGLFAVLMTTTLCAQFSKAGELLCAQGGPRRTGATAAFAAASAAAAALAPTRATAAASGMLTFGFVSCLGAAFARALPLVRWGRLGRADWGAAAAWRAAPTLLQAT